MSDKSLLDLAPELIHHIFDYLNTDTILLTVRVVCKQLFANINTYNRFKLSLKLRYRSDLIPISRIIRPESVISLTIFVDHYYHTYGAITLFLSLFKLDSFTQLQSLYFYNVRSNEVDLIMKQIPTKTLRSLSFIGSDQVYRGAVPNIVQSAIQIDISELQIYECIFVGTIDWPKQCVLQRLNLKKCSYKQYRFILDNLPCLRVLIVTNIEINDKNGETLAPVSTSQAPVETYSELIIYVLQWEIFIA
jgi:hypothetical protein